MQNRVIHTTPEEVAGAVRSLWKTDVMKAAQDEPGGYVQAIVAKAAAMPLVFFEMSDTVLERSHNSAWWRHIALRDFYQEPGVHDAYLLNQLVYVGAMTYTPTATFAEWFRKMSQVRLEAAINSEVLAYFKVPGLREQAFRFEIWADRFLSGAEGLMERSVMAGFKLDEPAGPDANHQMLAKYPATAEVALRDLYRDAMSQPNPVDYLELQIAGFAGQNLLWANVWSKRFRTVETKMAAFVAACETDPAAAVQELSRWLEYDVEAVPRMPVPFEHEAGEVAAQYQQHLKTYGNAVLYS